VRSDPGVLTVYKMAFIRYLGFLYFRNLSHCCGSERQYASPCHISWWSIKLLLRHGLRHGHLAVFKVAAFCCLVFSEVQSFNGSEGQCAWPCQTSCWSIKLLLRYGNLYIFRMAVIRHLGFIVGVLRLPTKSTWWSLSLCRIWLESMQWFW